MAIPPIDVPESTSGSTGCSKRIAVKCPDSLSHVVFRTSPANFAAMKAYWLTFLNARIAWENDRLVFLAYDEEHHRIAIFATTDDSQEQDNAAHLAAATAPPPSTGLAHIAFTFKSLRDLADAYSARRRLGIAPRWCVNHGATTSMYYHDPDGNEIETQAWNLDSLAQVDEYLETAQFRENPIGVDFDPEELITRLNRGEDESVIKIRANIGPRFAP